MQELLKKTYRLTFDLLDDRKVQIDFEQASLKEILEMSNAITNDTDMRKWLIEFLLKKSKPEDALKESDFQYLLPKRIVEIIEWLMDNYAKGFFVKKSKSDSLKEAAEKKGKIKPKSEVKTPTSSLICFLLKETNETVENLLKLTWEQIEYLIEGSVWNENSTTKAGQRRNERNAAMKLAKGQWSDEEALQMVRDMEKRIKEGKVKFNQTQQKKIT